MLITWIALGSAAIMSILLRVLFLLVGGGSADYGQD